MFPASILINKIFILATFGQKYQDIWKKNILCNFFFPNNKMWTETENCKICSKKGFSSFFCNNFWNRQNIYKNIFLTFKYYHCLYSHQVVGRQSKIRTVHTYLCYDPDGLFRFQLLVQFLKLRAMKKCFKIFQNGVFFQ